jgi:hypothetical protein
MTEEQAYAIANEVNQQYNFSAFSSSTHWSNAYVRVISDADAMRDDAILRAAQYLTRLRQLHRHGERDRVAIIQRDPGE